MSKKNAEDLPLQAVPFFARFLEGQDCEDLSEQESETISGGYETKSSTIKEQLKKLKANNTSNSKYTIFGMSGKYPSDNDERVVSAKDVIPEPYRTDDTAPKGV